MKLRFLALYFLFGVAYSQDQPDPPATTAQNLFGDSWAELVYSFTGNPLPCILTTYSDGKRIEVTLEDVTEAAKAGDYYANILAIFMSSTCSSLQKQQREMLFEIEAGRGNDDDDGLLAAFAVKSTLFHVTTAYRNR